MYRNRKFSVAIVSALVATLGASPARAATHISTAAQGVASLTAQSTFSGWSQVPGGATTPDAPAATVVAGRQNLFVRGADNRVYRNVLDGATWTGWGAVPGANTRSAPAAAEYAGELHVLVRGGDDQIYHTQLNDGGWTGFGSIGGLTDASPSAVTFGGALNVFMRGLNGRVYRNMITESSDWSGWSEVPGGLTTTTAVNAATSNGALYLVARNNQNNVVYNVLTGSGWTGWSVVPSPNSEKSAPAVSSFNGGIAIAICSSTDRTVQLITFNGFQWGSWSKLGSGFTSVSPTVVEAGSALNIYHRGETDAQIWRGVLTP